MIEQILLPLPDPDTAFFWDGCARGELLILRCGDCRNFVHYPRSACTACAGVNLAPERVSGHGTVHSYTVTHRAVPGYSPPFAVVLIELEEQRGLRMISTLTDVAPEDVRIGLAVEVAFEEIDGVALPRFRRRA